MATKSLSSRFNENLDICDTSNGQYSNLNLNQNHQYFLNAFSESSKNVLIEKRKVFNSVKQCKKNCNKYMLVFVNDDSKRRKDSHSWNTLTKVNNDYGSEKEYGLKKVENNSSNTNSSTLSLHIEAYENSAEVNLFNETTKQKYGSFVKQIFHDSTSFIQNSFEFSRQQENEDEKMPEVSQFRASQKLHNFNQINKVNFRQPLPQYSGPSMMHIDYDENDDDDLPPPPSECMTPKMMASPISSRPQTSKFSRFLHKTDDDENSLISYDAINGEDETGGLPELLSPLPNERAIDVPPNFPTTPQQLLGAPWKREYRGSHIVTSSTEKRSPDLRHSASTEGYARYTTPISSVPAPHFGTRLSSQRRLPYTPLLNMQNALDSPLTPRLSSFNASGRLQRWTPRRLDLDDSLVSYETTNEYVAESDFERFAKRLQAKLATEQNRLRDAKTTIQYWRKREGNQQSWNEICAHALLLLSDIRIKTYRDLITRVNAFHHMKHGPPPIAISARSVYTIYRMDINLSRDYYLKNTADDPNYVFILVGSTSEKTVASQLVEVSDTALMRSRRFHIDEEMVFKNLPLNFCIFLYLYVMKIEQQSRTPKAFAKKMAASLFSKFTPPVANHNTSIGSRNFEEITTGFELAGSFVFSRSSIGHFTAFLENPIYPLDGSAEINAKVSTLPEALAMEIKGIWKFIAETEVFNFYVEMKNGILNCYDIPDELNQLEQPKFIIDLSTICNAKIEPGNPIEHQFTFSFEVVVFPRGQDESSQKIYVVGLETEEEQIKWINAINGALQVIRGKQ